MYGDIGTKTCGGYPGMHGHLETDAQTYAEWGIDYLKVHHPLPLRAFHSTTPAID
jgi:hypothetical protein